MARKGLQPYVVDHQRAQTKVYIRASSHRFREGPVHELEPFQSEDTQLALTHISLQRKLIGYDPLAIPCLCFPVLGSESLHKRGNGSYSWGTSSAGRKGSPDSELVNSSKRHKGVEDTDSDSHLGIADFDPASLVRSREGTMKVPRSIQKYLDKHLSHCLTKEEREALFKEHPRPDPLTPP